jgi:hypothetical protein
MGLKPTNPQSALPQIVFHSLHPHLHYLVSTTLYEVNLVRFASQRPRVSHLQPGKSQLRTRC